ncbi:alpha beta-hydrolase [Crepidotus variabilis]|uniref:Carboxylic ester hydrolase n=1 Tax=Crepidotus variabilis TaxID=179855 RepID=A0A9P6JSY7_9AGAR|nr:alpha beta-hydrolase [Crepidotus variabilis]
MFSAVLWRVYLLPALSLICLSIAAKPADGTAISASPPVNLGYATYQGASYFDPFTTRTNTQFLGVRYAAPPIGSLRFAAPQKPGTVADIQMADQQPNLCYQANNGQQAQSPYRQGAHRRQSEDLGTSEDCLFLNVFVPGKVGDSKNLPVVAWIHGGGYIEGGAGYSFYGYNGYNGNDLIRASNGTAIVVVFQYRLGVFGFLAGQKVKDGGVLNAGLLDQQFALKWIQDNISKFGGDPQKVTIWGESAGAGSVLQHLVANGGKTNPPLFRAAITSSTFLPSQYKYNDRIPETMYNRTLAVAGCTTAKDSLQCLRGTDVSTLQIANTAISQSGFFGTFTWVPVVDGSFISDRPTVLLKQGKVNSNNYLGVTNVDEGSIFVNQNLPVVSPTTPLLYVANLFPVMEVSNATAATQVYSSFGTTYQQGVQMMADSIFLCPTYYVLKAFEKKAAFKSEFAIPPGSHGNDLAYYWPDGDNVIPDYNNQPFIDGFSQSFANFWTSLDPNKKWDDKNITPLWKTWTSATKVEMHFGEAETGVPDVKAISSSDALLQRCNFWDSISAATAQ